MEKYVKLSDIKDILNKLLQEPAYQHEGEDFYAGVCSVESELDCLTSYKILKGEWIMHINSDGYLNHYECSVCHQAQGHKSNYCEECGSDTREED